MSSVARPHDRTRVVLVGSVALLLGQGVVVAANLFITGLLSRKLTPDLFGLWAITLALASLSGHLDFGLGQALRNRLATLAERGHAGASEARRAFLSVFAFQVLAAGALLAVAIPALLVLPWTRWLALDPSVVPHDARGSVALLVAFLTVTVPLNLAVWGFFSYQESPVRSLLESIRAVLSLVVVAAGATLLRPWNLIAAYFAVFAVAAALGLYVFLRRRRWTFGVPALAEQLTFVRPMVRSSLRFWVLGATTSFVAAMPAVVAGRAIGLSDAGHFRVVQQMFSLLAIVHFTVVTPLWSAYTAAAHAGEWRWLQHSFRRSLWATLALFVGGGGLIVALSPLLLRIWVGRTVAPRWTVAMIAAWALITGWNNTHSVLLSGLNRTDRQARWGVFAAVTCIPSCFYLARLWGVHGLVLGAVLPVVPGLLSNVYEARSILRAYRGSGHEPTTVADTVGRDAVPSASQTQ